MTLVGSGTVMACGDCAPSHVPPEHHPLMVIVLIAALTLIGGAILIWQRRRRRRPTRVTDQWGALATMGELCPDGWIAEITLHEPQAAFPGDVDPGTRDIALRWKLYEDRGARVAIARRVQADTIGQALQMMVDDRRLDVTLEQIERSAVEAGESS